MFNSSSSTDENVQVVKLAKAEPAVGTDVQAMGWGRLETGSIPNLLQKAVVPVISDNVADSNYNTINDWSTKICTAVNNGVGTCNVSFGLLEKRGLALPVEN